jgi:hypothetical protein
VWGARPGLVSQEELAGGILLLLNQGDIADLGVEELRQRKCWLLTEQVLACYTRESHSVPVIRNAIIRYALRCPQGPKVKAFLAERRKDAPERVKDMEEWLAHEEPSRAKLPPL